MIRSAVLLALAGCTSTSITHVDVALTASDLTCVTAPLATVNSITVEGIGTANGQPCRLALRCIAASGSSGIAMIDQDLANASQPLLDVEAAKLVAIRIEGHADAACPATRNMCGAANVSAASGGVLQIGMTCDTILTADQCDNAVLPACP